MAQHLIAKDVERADQHPDGAVRVATGAPIADLAGPALEVEMAHAPRVRPGARAVRQE